MTEWKNNFLSTLVFLTRLPVKCEFEYRAKSENMAFFPLIGLILGCMILCIAYLSNVAFGSHIAAILTVMALVVLTGGLHIDGLSDSFDGLFSYRDKETIILIMKDSRIGAMGLLAVVFAMFLKIAFFELLIESGYILLIPLIPVVGRMAVIMACYKGIPINKSKMGEPFIGKLSRNKYCGIILFYTILMSALMYFSFGVKLVIANAVTILILHLIVVSIKKFVYEKIDGISGDILGAVCEITETIFIPIFYVGVYICNLFI